jgi:CRISPR/Cas system CSM-associated protein Csm3 (group 7 of RAMP superfamily)
MIIKYSITFLDYWHIGSGLSGGALYDSLVLKDKNRMPYIPGKTIKGLVRENFENITSEDFSKEVFGYEDGKVSKLVFSNAYMDKDEYGSIVAQNLQDMLYDRLAFTKINNRGIAEDDTLREIEVTVPLSLYGEIEILEEVDLDKIFQALKMVKRMGLNRNRGLGRCHIEIKDVK